MSGRWRRIVVAVLAAALSGCATSHPAPRPASSAFAYTMPDIPVSLRVAPPMRARYEAAWQRLQSGDPKGAQRALAAILKDVPELYPADAALGYAYLADRQFKTASAHFKAATSKDAGYLPAWTGESDAELGLGNDEEAIVAMERVLAIDPRRAEMRSRIDFVRTRQVQALIEAGQRARAAGRFDEARTTLGRAAALAPSSGVIYVELARTEAASADLDGAERDVRKALDLDPNDVQALTTLADVLDARGRYGDAAAAMSRAVAIDPQPEWKARAASLRERADLAALPPDFGNVETAPSVTRAQVAAFIGVTLGTLIDRAPRRVTTVVTDVRTHWAAPFILRVTQAGVMDVLPNHTFQPSAMVRRGDLAQVAAQLVALPGAGAAGDVARWTAARPRFADLPATNVFYAPAAVAVSSGAMRPDPDGRFQPTRLATGAELSAVVSRVRQLAQ